MARPVSRSRYKIFPTRSPRPDRYSKTPEMQTEQWKQAARTEAVQISTRWSASLQPGQRYRSDRAHSRGLKGPEDCPSEKHIPAGIGRKFRAQSMAAEADTCLRRKI